MSINYHIETKLSKIDGTGAFALQAIPKRRKIGNMTGDVITLRKARSKAKQEKRISIVEFGDGYALDASISNELKFINHSCSPNTYMRVAYQKVEFYSLREIKKGEELTCNYGPTHHDGKLKCQCGSKNCKRFI